MNHPWHPAVVALLLAQAHPSFSAGITQLRREFQSPPESARPWAYWWWLDSAATWEGITADFEAMKQQGISGVLLFDAAEGGTCRKGPWDRLDGAVAG